MSRKRPYILVAHFEDRILKELEVILSLGINQGKKNTGEESVLTDKKVFLIGRSVAYILEKTEFAEFGGGNLAYAKFFIAAVKIFKNLF